MKKCNCGKDAVWCYSTGFPNVDNTYFCDDCVSSADDDPCSCQYKPISFYDKPKGFENIDYKWVTIEQLKKRMPSYDFSDYNEKSEYYYLDEKGRPYPCEEYIYDENGFEDL